MSKERRSVLLKTEQDTVAFGELLGKASLGKGIVFLNGNLGMGKTTLCRGVLNAIGYHGRVKSPTYTLVEPYELPNDTVYHFDLYRLGHPEELEFMGIRDYLDEHAISLIEWPEKGAGVLPDADLEIHLDVEGSGRKVYWQGNTAYGREMAERLVSMTNVFES